jgi:hypothetical protein
MSSEQERLFKARYKARLAAKQVEVEKRYCVRQATNGKDNGATLARLERLCYEAQMEVERAEESFAKQKAPAEANASHKSP